MSDPTLPGGKKLCPSCTTYVGVNDFLCGNCGYNFETGENPGEGADAPGPPTEPLTVYSESKGPPRIAGQGLGKSIAVVALVIILAIGAGIYLVANRILGATEDLQDQVPGSGDFEFSPDTLGDGTNPATDFDSCVKLLNRYLRKVLANDGRPDNLPAVLEDAATEMGVGSHEFSAFTSIYTGTAGTAITDGTKAALKEAKKESERVCRREYG